jgi:hypothetical protein
MDPMARWPRRPHGLSSSNRRKTNTNALPLTLTWLMAERRSLLMIGQTISHYRILEKPGGRHGEVYRAQELNPSCDHQSLVCGFSSNPNRLRRFEQELLRQPR